MTCVVKSTVGGAGVRFYYLHTFTDLSQKKWIGDVHSGFLHAKASDTRANVLGRECEHLTLTQGDYKIMINLLSYNSSHSWLTFAARIRHRAFAHERNAWEVKIRTCFNFFVTTKALFGSVRFVLGLRHQTSPTLGLHWFYSLRFNFWLNRIVT